MFQQKCVKMQGIEKSLAYKSLTQNVLENYLPFPKRQDFTTRDILLRFKAERSQPPPCDDPYHTEVLHVFY